MGRVANKHNYNGEMLTIGKISLLTGLSVTTIRNRIRNGYSLEAQKIIRKNFVVFNEKGERECKDCKSWTKTRHSKCSQCRYITNTINMSKLEMKNG